MTSDDAPRMGTLLSSDAGAGAAATLLRLVRLLAGADELGEVEDTNLWPLSALRACTRTAETDTRRLLGKFSTGIVVHRVREVCGVCHVRMWMVAVLSSGAAPCPPRGRAEN